MKIREFNWKSADGLGLYGKYWAPDSNVKAVIALVHGLGEHINRYDSLASELVNAGYAVIGFDQRGHGRSEGQRGHAPNYELLLQGIDDLLHKAGEFFPEIPVFLMGHSMGGQLVLNYSLNRQPNVKGVIASSPFLKLAFDPPAWKVKLGKLVLNIFPALPQSTELETAAISQLPEEVKKYETDRLVHKRITPAMYFSLMDKAEYALQHAHEFRQPLLLYHGTADRLTSSEGTAQFATRVKGDITLKLFQGGYHETHHDVNRDELVTLLINWLNSKL